jgi:hypothetical protein
VVERGRTARTFADVVATFGAQVGWWQLGFRIRWEVARAAAAGRPHPDPVVASCASSWAETFLTAPYWWRLVRTAGLGVLLALFVAAMISLVNGVSSLATFAAAAFAVMLATLWWLISRTGWPIAYAPRLRRGRGHRHC